MKRSAIVQATLIVCVCALFAAKLPSLGDPSAPAISWIGALVGASIALIAVLIGTRFSAANPNYEPPATPGQLLLLRTSIFCLLLAVVSFTAYIYFPLRLFKVTTAIGIVVGAIAVFLGFIAKLFPAEERKG